MTRILGIETSCDETGVAIVEDGRRIVVSQVASQIDLHAVYGGVVPEIASRRHTEVIYQIVDSVIREAGGGVDAIAATSGPGLMGSLLVGVSFAKGLAYAWSVPYVPVQHIEGHIFSCFLSEDPPDWPFLALVVSGGHTQLVWCGRPHNYEVLGATRDDAVGESFDKVARLLGLPYPGGPSIERAARNGNPRAFDFPRSMAAGESLEFSYSGLKTAVLYQQRSNGASIEDLAASFQAAAIDILVIKTKQAIRTLGAPRLVVAGGVAANRLLRDRLRNELEIPVHMPPMGLCVDNGAMIAAVGHSQLERGIVGDFSSTADPSLPLDWIARSYEM